MAVTLRKNNNGMRLFLLLAFGLVSLLADAQSYVETSYTPSRAFLDKDRQERGSGDLWQVKGMYTFPFSMKMNDNCMPVVWAGTLTGMYAVLDNKGFAARYNPGQILNLSFNVTHIRPLGKNSKKWYIMASLGAGIYSAPNNISFQSILVNGGIVFAYRLAKGLDVGVGAGLTNSFGVPLVMPMTFLKWTTTGRYEIYVEAMSNVKVSVARRFGKFKMELVPFDMDGMSSVFRQDGKSKIYSVMRMRSYLRPELKVGKCSFVYLNAGVDLFHSVNVTNRSIKGFVDNFTKDDKWSFNQQFNLSVGFKYGF